MTRIPTATRRQRVEVRASQTGPKLPRLHALPRPWPAAVHATTGLTTLHARPGLVIARQEQREPFTDRRKRFLPALGDRVSKQEKPDEPARWCGRDGRAVVRRHGGDLRTARPSRRPSGKAWRT